MNIKILFIAIIITAVVVGGYFAFRALTAPKNPYRDDQFGFSIDFPKGWEIQQGTSEVVVQAVNPANKKVSMNIVVKSLPAEMEGQNSEELIQSLKAEKIINLQDASLKGYGTLKLGKTTAVWIRSLMRHDVTKDVSVYIGSYNTWSIAGRRMYIFNGAAVEQTEAAAAALFAQYEQDFAKTARTLRLH